jgi:hypothetical protein
VKYLAPLVPRPVLTVTLSLPRVALVGTRQRMRVAVHEMYRAHARAPNFTTFAPRLAPNHLPVMVTIAPRLPEVDESFVIAGFGELVLVRLAPNLVAWSTVNMTQPKPVLSSTST